MLFAAMAGVLISYGLHDPMDTVSVYSWGQARRYLYPRSFPRSKQTISRVLFPSARQVQHRGGGHQSRPAVTSRLKQSTRKHRAGRPQALSYLILLRIGFAKLPSSPTVLVSSYLTFSPLPPTKGRPIAG